MLKNTEAVDIAEGAGRVTDCASITRQYEFTGTLKTLTHFNTATYDLQGRRLSHVLSHGIYIKNGKKYVR